ncbi:MAG TPA: enoyl-CoA hydratase-related protein [Acidimicrobiia bacterium]|nr:enoyl-CoA hydratase-related protein [Acidimicrobiia bacterium]
MTDEVKIAVDDGVALLTLDRPPLNALSASLLAELAQRAHAIAADATVKAVVITGNDRAFAAGADVTEFSPDRESARIVAASFRTAADALAAIERPVIAAIRGYALGGGLEVALACDLRVAADNARVGQPEILLGIIPGGGATQRLARLVGASRAKELIWSGRQVRADEALAIGLVDKVVPADAVLDEALRWAQSFASGAVAAMGFAKRAIDDGIERTLAEGLDLEADRFADSFATNDAATGIASYLEHGPGKATFSGS